MKGFVGSRLGCISPSGGGGACGGVSVGFPFCQLRGDVLMMGVGVVAEEEGAGVGRGGGETVLV